MTASASRVHRAAVLPATLIFVAVVVLAASSLIATASSRRSGDESWAGRDQARLAALSGIDAALAELVNQRADLLAGEDPSLTAEWTLASDDRFEWVVRVVGVQSDNDAFAFEGPRSIRATSEAARLDLRAAPEEMLQAIPGLIDAGGSISGLRAAGSSLVVATKADDETSMESLVTVLARDPEVQGGVGGTNALASEGQPRIDLASDWTEDTERAIADRFGDDFAASLASRMSREPLGSMSSFVRWVVTTDRGLSDDPSPLGEFVDGVSFSGNEMVAGRVDVSRAGPLVLSAVLGVSDGEAVASARDALSEEDLTGIGWLIADGHIDLDRFAEIADLVTYRTLQWRVLVEAGRRPVSDGASVGPIDDLGVPIEGTVGADGLEYRVAYEAVIDVAEVTGRVVSMRDVTLLGFVDRFDPVESESLEADQDRDSFEEDPLESPLIDEPETSDSSAEGV